MENPSEYIECKICEGTGIYISEEPECCGYFDEEGYCCGCVMPKFKQEQCVACQATGLIPNH